MFQAISSKIINGVISLSMLFLSTYEGNDAAFAAITANFLGNNIYLKTQLINAFENDFEEIFKSGQKIDIFFEIKIKNNSAVIHTNEFKHSVVFDPMSQFFTIELEEQEKSLSMESYQQLLETISNVEYSYKGDELTEIDITLTSFLKKIHLESINKEYDMMMLWNFKKPKIKQQCIKGENES
ncbi:MAG: hypothetical protein K8R49_07760 [Candidatus Cloacimonetes bacterium]|nr:hypothetical protein [Candidatus Cloacimonadota bacterium]